VLTFSKEEIHDKAVYSGYDSAALTPQQLAKIKVMLAEEHRAAGLAGPDDGPYIGGQITIRPGHSIELDGKPLPAAKGAVEITVSDDPAMPSTVRLTLLAHTVQTIKES
jgi:hypothetical protein